MTTDTTTTTTTYCNADDGRAHQGNPVPAIGLFSSDEDYDLGAVPLCGECAIACGVITIADDIEVEWIN